MKIFETGFSIGRNWDLMLLRLITLFFRLIYRKVRKDLVLKVIIGSEEVYIERESDLVSAIVNELHKIHFLLTVKNIFLNCQRSY